MIKAQELRIGNLVVLRKRMEQVESWMFIQETKNMEPIPLTPEILRTFRFKKEFYEDEFTWRVDTPTGEIIFSSELVLCSTDTLCKIEHLHQLQNLYFALTGEDLQPKIYTESGQVPVNESDKFIGMKPILVIKLDPPSLKDVLETPTVTEENDTPESIVEENFKGLDELIPDSELNFFYKNLIVECIEDYARFKVKQAISFTNSKTFTSH